MKYESWPPAQQRAHASRILAKAGVRLMNLDEVMTVGIWSDLDSKELRWALAMFGSGDTPWLYLDGPGTPERYKLRAVPGDPVDPDILALMLSDKEKPWETRDLALKRRKEAKSGDGWMALQRKRIFEENAAEREKKCAGMDVFARERLAIEAEEAARKPDEERKRELRIVQKNWKMYERWRREQPEEALAWRERHKDRNHMDNWLRDPDLPWGKGKEELWKAADHFQYENPEWPPRVD